MELKNLLPSRHGNVSWWAFAQTVVPLVLLCVGLVWALLHFVHSAPPHTLTITSGPKGSNFESIAQRYGKILARSGIELNVLPSQGSLRESAAHDRPEIPCGYRAGAVRSDRRS